MNVYKYAYGFEEVKTRILLFLSDLIAVSMDITILTNYHWHVVFFHFCRSSVNQKIVKLLTFLTGGVLYWVYRKL